MHTPEGLEPLRYIRPTTGYHYCYLVDILPKEEFEVYLELARMHTERAGYLYDRIVEAAGTVPALAAVKSHLDEARKSCQTKWIEIGVFHLNKSAAIMVQGIGILLHEGLVDADLYEEALTHRDIMVDWRRTVDRLEMES